MERYLAVCHPLRAKTMCTVRAAWAGLALTAFISFAYNFCRFFEHSIVNGTTLVDGLKADELYNHLYGMYMELVVSCLIPFSTLCLLNFRIIRAVNDASRLRSNRTKGPKKVCFDLTLFIPSFSIHISESQLRSYNGTRRISEAVRRRASSIVTVMQVFRESLDFYCVPHSPV